MTAFACGTSPETAPIPPALHPIDLITRRRWRSALFTTYSLTLSFFEGHILRQGLKKNGCERIWVVTDCDGYANSLAESRATGVGHDYRVCPVGLPAGVFHPKCVYLHGDDMDVLLVGSGNLTAGGFGRNIETVQAFNSRAHTEVFGDFARFLRSLDARKDIVAGERGWLDHFTTLADAVGSKSQPAARRRLVHSADRPVIEQFVEAASGSEVSELRILSPFFDPTGKAVRALTDALRPATTVIGVLPGQGDRSTFPFPTYTPAVRAATFGTADSARRLHAKIIEAILSDGAVLSLAGSVNCTEQSLCSTRNIELAVLRFDRQSPWAWVPSPVPRSFVRLEFQAAGVGAKYFAEATLSVRGRLIGRVLGTAQLAARWIGTLVGAAGASTDLDITTGPDGRFAVPVAHAADLDDEGVLQLTLTAPTATARGWVNNEWWLQMAGIPRFPGGEVQRVIRGDATDEDRAILFDFLSANLELLVSPRSPAAPNARGSAPDSDAEVPAERLLPHDPGAESDHQSRVLPAPDRLDRLFEKLLASLPREAEQLATSPRGRDDDATAEEEIAAGGNDDEEAEDVRTAATALTAAVAVRRFCARAKQRLTTGTSHATAARLAEYWLLALPYHLREGKVAAQRFAQEWLLSTTSMCRSGVGGRRIDELVAAVAAQLAANATAKGEASRKHVTLHEALETFGLTEATTPWAALTIPAVLHLAEDPSFAPEASLRKVYAAPTKRQEAVLLWESIASGTPLPESISITHTGHGATLKRLLASVAGARGLAAYTCDLGARTCPSPRCQLVLRPVTLAELGKLRLSRCTWCDSFLINVE